MSSELDAQMTINLSRADGEAGRYHFVVERDRERLCRFKLTNARGRIVGSLSFYERDLVHISSTLREFGKLLAGKYDRRRSGKGKARRSVPPKPVR